jgi:leucyl-tRNA synthetase
VVPVIQPEEAHRGLDEAYEGEGVMVNSGPFDGQPSATAWHGIAAMLEQVARGERTVRYRMRDWLISRQRYWGAPIPIIHCEACGTVPVPETDLPVLLPHLPDYVPRGDGRAPLANLPEFVRTSCPSCGGQAKRETDTMGGFACSSWYFLRYSDPHYDGGPFNPEAVRRWLPVDLYVGGAEHAVMHLLYSRFWTKVLADAGLIHFREPFPRLASQGILHASDGKRMSKSGGNVVTPDEVGERHGADVLRLYLLFMAPFERNVFWDEEGIAGVRRFLQRVWRLCLESWETRLEDGDEEALRRATHRTIQRVTEEIEAFKFNTAIAALMELANTLRACKETVSAKPPGSRAQGPMSAGRPHSTATWAVETLVRLLAPFSPHIAEELWARLGGAYSVHEQAWPSYDPALAADETVTLVIQVNGKVRDRVTVLAGISDQEARSRAHQSRQVRRHLNGREPDAIIVVPGRLVNIVV